MTLTRLTAIDGEAILPLAAAKEQVRVTHTDEDTLIGTLRDIAIADVEQGAGVALAPTQYRWTMGGLPSKVELPVKPVASVDAVAYFDSAGAEQAYTGARLINGTVYPAVNASWPSAYDYAAVTFTAGPLDTGKQEIAMGAVRLLLSHLYRNREAVIIGTISSELPLGVRSLLDKLGRELV